MSRFNAPAGSEVRARDRILVVDDSPDNLFLIQSILAEEGYDCTLAADGEQALALVLAAPPQLLLLDVMMPGMDGFALTQCLRGDPTLPYIPILLITAYDQASVVKGLDSGADDFIRKPVEVDELLARVRSLLRLKHSVDERDAFARQREDFASRLTHDLRTPLVAAGRMLELLQQGVLGELSPAMAEAIAVMARSNGNLLAMVNALLAVYRYEAGRKHLNIRRLDLVRLVAEVVEELQTLAWEKGLALTTDLPGVAMVAGDRLELHRVFTNLLGNALKFTEQGQVTVTLQQEDGQVTVAIADTGPGLAETELPHLFERFRPGRHKHGGSGLGLHLSHCIVDAHGGAIAVESELGHGSCFQVRLPLAALDRHGVQESGHDPLRLLAPGGDDAVG